MELARSADWIVDLGPEAGDDGGRLVGEGTPETVAALDTPTGRALAEALGRRPSARRAASRRSSPSCPRRPRAPSASRARASTTCSAWTSTSRATSSSRSPASRARASRHSAFDVLFAEGQRRFLDCLSTYVRQFIRPLARPEVDRLEGVPPTVALEQKLSRGTPLSTVGTASEVYHHLRLLWSRLGAVHCPKCGLPGQVVDVAALAARVASDFPKGELALFAPLVQAAQGLPQGRHPRSREEGRRRGAHRRHALPGRLAAARRPLPDPRRRGAGGSRRREDSTRRPRARDRARPRARCGDAPGPGRSGERFYSTRRACPSCGTGLPAPDPRLFSWSQKYGACPECDGFGAPRVEEDGELRRAEGVACPACAGTRLRPEARAVRIAGRHIGEVAALTLREARAWLGALEGQLPDEVRERVWPELVLRLDLLDRLGLSYLTLERGADTLSTGEAQRIRIVAALASNLRGVCYVLDEPTVGLHPRDDEALTHALLGLRDRGNTVVVVEHEESVIRAADHLIDLGPGAGPHGGRLVAQGTPRQVARVKESVTGRWLRGEGEQPPWPRRSLKDAARLARDGRAAPQPARPDGRVPARALHGRHRRLGLGQVHARARRALPRGEGATRRPAAAAGAAGAQGPARRRARPRGGRVADRPHAPLGARDLRGDHGRDPDAVRRGARRARARLRQEPLLVQRQGRPLRALRGPGAPARDDGPAARHVRPLRGVPRAALQRRHAGGLVQGQDRGRGAGDDDRRGAPAVLGRGRRPAAARLPVRDRPRLPAARPAVADPLRRRGAAHQARRRS